MLALSDTINRLIGCETCHERLLDFGERVWVAKGTDLEAVYYDEGNGWCWVCQILPQNKVFNEKFRVESKRFFQGLREADDE